MKALSNGPKRGVDFTKSCARSRGGVTSGDMAGDAGRGRRWLSTVGLALYAVFLVTAPFEHHDFVCHLKNPRHCTSCTASQLGSDPQSLPTPGISQFVDAGCAPTPYLIAHSALLTFRSSGRSPPTFA
jgi:hypothetical protein